MPTFKRIVLPSTSRLEAALSSEMLVPNHHTKWHKNPENCEYCFHCCENIKYQKFHR